MDDLSTIIQDAIEQAGISGLCREGRIEIALQAARTARPDLDDEELLDLVEIEASR